MTYADGDGEIHVRAFRDGCDVVIEVTDNGPGMPEDVVERLLDPAGPAVPGAKAPDRIPQCPPPDSADFGPAYGLTILSEPDAGTAVRIRIPALDREAAERYRKEGER